MFGFYAISFVTGLFSDTFILWVATNSVLLCKPVYGPNKEKIHQLYERAYNTLSDYVQKVVEKIPKYVEKN